MKVTDPFSGRQLDVQSLLNVARATEQLPGASFSMKYWDCGTTCCMVGAFQRASGERIVSIAYDSSDMSRVGGRFGLSLREAVFLFSVEPAMSKLDHPAVGLPERRRESKKAALARLRKFLYYKLRKAELLADYEQARRTGDVGVAREALSSTTEAVEAMACC